MSKSNACENDVIKLMFLGTDPAWRDAVGQPDLYLALHSADPTDAGTQTSSEIVYTSYLRVAVARTAGGWVVAGNQASNTALLQFPKCTGLVDTARYVSIGLSDTGIAGQILYSGQLTSDLAVSTNIQPQFAIASLVVTED